MFDVHYHLDNQLSLQENFAIIEKVRDNHSISRFNIIVHEDSKFRVEDVCKNYNLQNHVAVTLQVNPLSSTSVEKFWSFISEYKIDAIKLHPRINQYSMIDKKVFEFIDSTKTLKLPIFVCTFWDGTWNRYGLKLSDFANVADSFEDIRFIWAHFGGHKIMDFMMMMRRRENVFADISLTQHYFYSDYSVEQLAYCISSLKANRIMFGSDFPNLDYDSIMSSYHRLEQYLEKFRMTKIDLLKLTEDNAYKIFPRLK